MNSHETTTISHRVQVQFGFGTIYNINWELPNKWAEFKSYVYSVRSKFCIFLTVDKTRCENNVNVEGIL